LPWSYTQLDLFQTCGKWVYHKYVVKDLPPEVKTEEQLDGIAAHEALERRCRDGVPLPAPYSRWEPFCRSMTLYGPPLTEFKVGIGNDFAPRDFWASDVWGRGVLDIAKVYDRSAFIADWKTGKVKEKPLQLDLFALFGFAHWPVDTITACNIWLKPGKIGTPRTYRREQLGQLWSNILPTINAMQRAEESGDWRAQPGPLCGWCPVMSCTHNPRKP
jgi:hypothetical protein